MQNSYRRLPIEMAQDIIGWCEDNNIDYDIYNGFETFMCGEPCEIGIPSLYWEAYAYFSGTQGAD